MRLGLSSANSITRPTCSLLTPVHDGDDRDDVDAGLEEVLDRAQLDVEQIADAAVELAALPMPSNCR
jgi:hypothetical protein